MNPDKTAAAYQLIARACLLIGKMDEQIGAACFLIGKSYEEIEKIDEKV